jgi:CheY-like chemotaxis protein
LWREADRLHLSIQDEGRGFSEEFRDHLFDRFAQSDAPDNRHHGGLGLGLSIVRNLAELHGGQATAYSAGEGKGATFEVHLLAAPPGDEEVQTPGEGEADVELDGRQLQGLEVLVVEDNVDASEILRVVLSDAGAKVRVAADYVTALQMTEQAWPHVLVSDIGLPGRDGYDLVRQLRHLGQSNAQPRFFAVAMTAFSRPQDQIKAFDAGFDAHLTKPLQPHALINLIAERPAQDLTT